MAKSEDAFHVFSHFKSDRSLGQEPLPCWHSWRRKAPAVVQVEDRAIFRVFYCFAHSVYAPWLGTG